MLPKLIAISGPLKGQSFPISDAEFCVGRELSGRVVVNDPLVSRRHCSIEFQGDQVRLVDLESLNGTFVNGMPAHERVLEHGDRISIGSSQFVFLKHETADSSFTSLNLADLDALAGQFEHETTITVELQHADGVYFDPDRLAAEIPPGLRIARDLSALLRVSTAINAIRNQEELQVRLLELIFDVLPAERAAILLLGHNQEEFVSGTYRQKNAGGAGPFRVSQSVTRHVLRAAVAVVANNISNDIAARSFTATESLIASRVRSVLCVPLTVFDTKLGVIYADTTDLTAQFDQTHLQLLTGVAAIASVALEHARYFEWLEGENRRLRDEINIEHDMVGDSPRLRDVYHFISKVAGAESTVLIRGESGTGKELVARAIHRNSRRASLPFVAVSCAALVETLLESELFGHEKGAFTGAIALKKGKIEIAQGGTLFLDEIGELAPPLQAKLLRVLQQREFERVGGTRPIQADVRIITATNRNLEEAMKGGTFRQDLYFRLNVVSVTMPPLRERREDIPLLAAYFVRKYARESSRPIAGISREAHALLRHYDWPGNVRELENAIERAIVLGSSDHLRPEDLPESLLERQQPSQASELRYHNAVNSVKRQLILRAVQESGGSITEAARRLDLHPNYLHRLIRNMDLRGEIEGQ
jgi:Nif-specific regulatory protein